MAAAKLSEVAVQIEAIGLDQVKAALRELGADGQRSSERLVTHYGKAARSLTLVTNEAVRAGELGGNALQKLLTIGGDMAGLFGVGGTVVGALAVAGLAVFNYFDRAQKKIEEMANAARTELRSLRDMSAKGIAERINTAVSGDPLAVTKEGKRDPYGELSKAQLEEMTRRIQHGKDIGVDVRTESEVRDKLSLQGLNEELARRNDLIRDAIPLLQKTATLEGQTEIARGKPTAEAAEAALTKRIKILSDGLIFDTQRATITKELQALEKQLTAATNDGTASIERRAQSALHLADVQAALEKKFTGVSRILGVSNKTPAGIAGGVSSASDLMTTTSPGGTPGGRAQDAYGGPMALVKAAPDNLIKEQMERWKAAMAPFDEMTKQIGDTIRGGLAHTLGDAIFAGFSAGFSGKGLGGIFKALGKSVLAGIGGIFGQLGQIWLTYGATMFKWSNALWNPATSGIAALAIGALLIAMSAALGAAGSGGGGGGGPGAVASRPAEITNIKLTATSVADAARLEPQARIHQTIIGPNDPAAFREIQRGLDNHARR
jgi:hypothetical protein